MDLNVNMHYCLLLELIEVTYRHSHIHAEKCVEVIDLL